MGVAASGNFAYVSFYTLLTYMSPALVAYEYVITLDQEISTVWSRKRTASSALLLSIRWVMVLNQVVSYIPASSKVCDSWPRWLMRSGLILRLLQRSVKSFACTARLSDGDTVIAVQQLSWYFKFWFGQVLLRLLVSHLFLANIDVF